MIRYLYPTKIKEVENVINADGLFHKKDLQIGLNEPDIVKFQPNSAIVLDFGKEIRGGVRILTYETQDIKCVRIRIRFGESLSECFAELGEKNATNDHSPRDIEADLSAWSDLCFGDTGFRFVRIDSLSDGWFCVKSIVAKSYELNKQPIYSYDGNDKLVSAIFDAAKRTIDLCSVGQYVYDGIKRDRLVWVGDMYPEMLALTTLYGSFPALERSLNFAKKQYPLPQFMYNMPTYSLWWILLVCDYYDKTSKKEFLSDKLEYMFELLKLFDKRIGVDGKLDLNNCLEQLFIRAAKAREQFGVCSLTTEKSDSVMWKDYANNGTGYCVEYDLLNYRYSELLFPVVYNDQRENNVLMNIVCDFIGQMIIGMSNGLIDADRSRYLRMFLTKELKWQYQKEWRLIGDAGQKIQAPAIKTVYLGKNVQAVNANKMEKFCNENQILLEKSTGE